MGGARENQDPAENAHAKSRGAWSCPHEVWSGAGAFFIPSTMRAPWSLTRKIGTMRRVADRNETRALSLAGGAGYRS